MKSSILIAVTLLASLTAGAQSMRTGGSSSEGRNIEVGVTYLPSHMSIDGNGRWLQGAGAELSADVFHGIGIAANFTGGHKSETFFNGTINGNIGAMSEGLSYETFTFGPRYTFRQKRSALYGEALFGMAHANGSVDVTVQGVGSANIMSGSANSFALQIGGGYDFSLTRRIALRLPQVHYLRTSLDEGVFDSNQHGTPGITVNAVQLGAGVVFRFNR